MELRHLRYFLAFVDAGTVSAAARQLHVAQPAVSRQLHQLELDLGLTLFERDGQRLRLTIAGRELIDAATDLVARSDRLHSSAEDLAHGRIHRLVISAATTAISKWIAPFLATLAPPDPLVLVQSIPPRQMLSTLRTGADLVISSAPPMQSMARRSLPAVPLLAYVAPSHDWAREQRRAITVDELVNQNLILLPGEHATRTVLDMAVTRGGLAYRNVEECAEPQVIQSLAAGGFGVGVITDLPRFGAYPLLIHDVGSKEANLTLGLHAAWDPRHYAATSIESLVERITAFAADRTYVGLHGNAR
jgi:DNA-binding transcriptional LysR family regulator